MPVAIGILAALVIGVNIAGLVLLHRRATVLQRRLDAMTRRAGELEERAHVVPPDISESLAANRKRVITVELLDPIGLATSRTPLAGPVGAVAPAAISKIVHDQTLKTLRDVLAEYGVEADVQLVNQ